MGIHQCVADEDAILIMLEDDFLLQNHATNAIERGRNFVAIKLTNVLVALRTEVVALIFMQTKVEFGTMLHDCHIQ